MRQSFQDRYVLSGDGRVLLLEAGIPAIPTRMRCSLAVLSEYNSKYWLLFWWSCDVTVTCHSSYLQQPHHRPVRRFGPSALANHVKAPHPLSWMVARSAPMLLKYPPKSLRTHLTLFCQTWATATSSSTT